jgi:type I restriction enzyme R subunit
VTLITAVRLRETRTFVPDFRNEARQITESFRPWHERTVAVPTDPNLLHDLADRVYGLQLFDSTDAAAIGSLIADRTKKVTDHGTVNALLSPIVDRFGKLATEVQDEARELLDRYVRAYSFLSQVVDFGDGGLEALYLACRALIASLPTRGGGGTLDLGAEVQLTYLRQEKTSEGSISLVGGAEPRLGIREGRAAKSDPAREHLSAIITVLNERFGTMLGTADQLFFDQLEATWLADEQLVAQARANPIENFRLVFNDTFIKSIVTRMDDNQDLFQQILDDETFKTVAMEHYLRRVFDWARRESPGIRSGMLLGRRLPS